MSAMGFPKRVTRNGRPVRRTRSNVARQVALNFEIAIVSMQLNVSWSLTMVNCLEVSQRRSACSPRQIEDVESVAGALRLAGLRE